MSYQFPFYSAEVRLDAVGVVTGGGYLTLQVTNLRTNLSQINVTPGCPPPTNCTSPLMVQSGDMLRVSGTVMKCDQTPYNYADIGPRTVTIKSGACGDQGYDMDLITATIYNTAQGRASFTVDVQVSANLAQTIADQKALGIRFSMYARLQ